MTNVTSEILTSAAANAEYQAVLQHHSKSFALASKLLPRACRDDAAIVYTWCRRADDAIDVPSGEGQNTALARLERELGEVYSGVRQSNPLLAAFARVAAERKIPLEYPRALLTGMAMDRGPVAYQSVADLITYCFRVAGSVGLMMCHVMGVRHTVALRHAADLGIAMQLTNICRDVQEDWQRGRLYLPRELFSDAARAEPLSPTAAPLTARVREHCRPVVIALLELADGYYTSGDRGLAYLAPRAACSVRTARLVYAAIGERVRATGADVLADRAVVGRLRKATLLGQAGLTTLFARGAHGGRFEPAALEDSLGHVRQHFPL